MTGITSRSGGVVAVVKDVQYALVAKPDSVTLFIEDHGKKVDTKGATAKLTLRTGSDKTELALAPVGGKGLEAKGAFKVPAGTNAVATVVLAGKPATNAQRKQILSYVRVRPDDRWITSE